MLQKSAPVCTLRVAPYPPNRPPPAVAVLLCSDPLGYGSCCGVFVDLLEESPDGRGTVTPWKAKCVPSWNLNNYKR